MPITLKKDVWKVKDPSSGQYRGAAILSTTLPQDAAQIISESNATIQNIKDTAIEAVDTALNDESTGIIPTAQSDRDDVDDSLNNINNGIIPTAQANLATIAAAVQSQIGQGTDKTLSVAKGFADAKAAGMMVKVSNYQPGSALDDPRTSQDASQNTGYPVYKDSNRVWVKETYAELEVPTIDDVDELKSAINIIADSDEISISRTLNAKIYSDTIVSASYSRMAYAALNNEKLVTITKDEGKMFSIGFTETIPANGVATFGIITDHTATKIVTTVPIGAKYVAIYYYNTNYAETETAEDMLASIKIVGVVSALDPVAREIGEQAAENLSGLVAFKNDTGVKRASYNIFDGKLNTGYISKTGTLTESDSYRYTDKIDIHDLIGKTVKLYNDGTQKYIRFVCIYDENNTVNSSLGSNTNSLTFTIPSGAYYAVFSFTVSSVNTPYVLITTGEKTVYVPHINKWGIKDFPAVDAFVNIAEPLVLSAASLADDEELKAKTGNSVKTYGTYAMFCRPGTMTDDEYIIFGKNGSNGYAVGISKTKWAWFVNGNNQGGGTHSLTIKDYLFVTVNKVPGTGAVVTIYTNGGVYTRTNTSWQDYHGLQYIKNESGDTITEVKMTWGSSAFRHGIWFFGDSYTSGSDARWPYYISQLGFSGNILINGYPGEETDIGYKDFIDCIKYGKPTIAVWCLGMNNGDSGAINETWLKYTQAFLDVCELFDITPVLATIPCCPLADNQYKNAWVRASGYRYIEFANAVNVTENSTTWYDGMLSSDNIHPTAQGAKALASQIIVSVPEIIQL